MQNIRVIIFFLTFLSLSQARSTEFWNEDVSYSPPFKMFTNSTPGNAARTTEDWEFYTMASDTNGIARVVFHIETIAKFIEPEIPAKPVKTISDLKGLVDAGLKTEARGTNYSTSIIEINGRQALSSRTRTNNIQGGPSGEWLHAVCFFWDQNTDWQKTTVCTVVLTAEKRETLNILENSLKTIKFQRRKQKN